MSRFLKAFRMGIMSIIFMTMLVVVFSLQPAEVVSGSEKILRIACDAGDIGSLDPGYHKGTQDTVLQDMIFDGLLRFKPGDVNVIEPDIAEKFEITKDGMELTFYLHKGVMTHPFEGYPEGYEFTAEDVVFSIQKTADPKLSSFAGEFKNFTAEAIDKYTVKVKLKERIPTPERTFVDVKAGQMIPKKAFETLGPARFKTQPVGTGPFRVVEYLPGQKVILAAHENYWRGRPRIDGVEALMMPDVNSREFAFRKGEADIIEGIREQPWIDKMEKLPNAVVDIIGPGDLAFLSFNMSKKPFDNPLVRKAIIYGTNRDEIRAFIGSDASGPAWSVVPSYLPGGLTGEEVEKRGLFFKTDIEKAKELLSKAGYPNGLTMQHTISQYALYRRPTENLQAQWKKIGVDMKLNVVDHPTYHTRIRQDANSYVLYICARPSTDVWLTYFFHSDSIVVTGKAPITNFSHCKIVDDLIEAARKETDKKKQIQLWKEAQYKILENAIALPLYVVNNVWGRNNRVKLGFELKSSLAYYPQINEMTRISE